MKHIQYFLKTSQRLTNHLVIRERERVKSQEISVTSVIINIILHIIRQKRPVDWGAQNGDAVSQILENLDSVVLGTSWALAHDSGFVNDSIHGGIVLTTSRVGVTKNGVLQKGSSIVKCVDCVVVQQC